MYKACANPDCNGEFSTIGARGNKKYCQPSCYNAVNAKAASERQKAVAEEKNKQEIFIEEYIEPIAPPKPKRYEVYYNEPKIKHCDFGGCGRPFTAYKLSDINCYVCNDALKRIQKQSLDYNTRRNDYDDNHLNPQTVRI